MINKKMFDAALIPDFRSTVGELYNKRTLIGTLSDPSSSFFRKHNIKLRARCCPLCSHPPESARKIFEKWGSSLYDCPSCGMTYATPILPDGYDYLLSKEAGTSAECDKVHQQVDYSFLKKNKSAYIVQEIENWAGPIDRFLEIGFLGGDLLRAAIEKGWTCLGIDQNEEAVRKAQENDLPAACAFLPDDEHIIGEKYDCIAMLDVLEHISAPLPFISMLKNYLAPGGVIAVQVPNYDSLIIRLNGIKDWNFCHGHHNHFTLKSLDRLFRFAGFANVFQETFITELDRIEQYDRLTVRDTIFDLTGLNIRDEELNWDFILNNNLGYKVFSIFRAD